METPRDLRLLRELEKIDLPTPKFKLSYAKIALLITIAAVVFVYSKLIQGLLVAIENKKLLRPDFEGPEPSDFLWLFILCPLMYFGHFLTHVIFSGFYYKYLPKSAKEPKLKKRIRVYISSIFRFLFFTLVSVYGLIILYENEDFSHTLHDDKVSD